APSLRVRGLSVDLRLLEIDALGPAEVAVASPVEFALAGPTGVTPKRWALEVIDADGRPVWRSIGEGVVPAKVAWEGAPRAGHYRYRLTVEDGGGGQAWSAERTLGAGGVPLAPPLRPVARLFVGGRAIRADDKGLIKADVDLDSDEPLLLDVTDTRGRRAILVVLPESPATPGPSPTPSPSPTPPQSRILDARPVFALDIAAGSSEFGADEIEKAFAPAEAAQTSAKAQAADLVVWLPRQGERLGSEELGVRGHTHPENTIRINGREAFVEPNGDFFEIAKVPLGPSELVIESVDPDGNRATLRWPVEVSEQRFFLMALADGAVAEARADLYGVTDETSLREGSVLMHGRTALYLKARIKGDTFFKRYLVTTHFDSGKRREMEEFFELVVDPNRYYPIYGDSADEIHDVDARGKLYVLVEADESKLLVGNFRSDLRGVELFRYDRTFYGAQVDFKKKLFGERLGQELKAFVSDDSARLAHDHNVFRATGGSIYYLRHAQLIEGSEQVRLVVRDRGSGVSLASIPQARDSSYVIDYIGGRILFSAPVPSFADAGFILSDPSQSLSALDGNPVYVEVDYEFEDTREVGGTSHGAYARETLFDVLSVGGGYVEERRAEDVDYRLYGAELQLRPKSRTLLVGEVAQSESFDALNFYSEDGGLSFLSLNEVPELRAGAQPTEARAYRLELTSDIAEFFGSKTPDAVKTHGYWHDVDRGFFAGGSILEQGRRKYGAELGVQVRPNDRVTLKHDGAIAEMPQLAAAAVAPDAGVAQADGLAFTDVQTELSAAQWLARRGRLELRSEYAHGFLDNGVTEPVHRDTVGLLGTYRVSKRWTLLAGQEGVVHVTRLGEGTAMPASPTTIGDPMLNEQGDRLTTTVGAGFHLAKELEMTGTYAQRWSGDNAAVVGLRNHFSERSSFYVNERFEDRDGRTGSATVIGGEERFGKDQSGRSYGEYHVESGINGAQNRAIMGLVNTWPLRRGHNVQTGLEHQAVYGGRLLDGTPTGDQMRDVVYIGSELVRWRRFKLANRGEIRFDDADEDIYAQMPAPPTRDPRLLTNADGVPIYADRQLTAGSALVLPADRLQLLTINNVEWFWTRDLAFLVRFNFSRTENRTEDRLEARFVELGAGWALRPVAWDWLNVIFKYTRVWELRPAETGPRLDRRRVYDVISLVPVFELPWRLQLIEKWAWKRIDEELEVVPGADPLATITHTALWINRINYHLTRKLDAGAEYRVMALWTPATDGPTEVLHGTLVEMGYWVSRYARLGLGYNFSRISENEFQDQDRDARGFFVRVVGRY
ncbi:MAG: hypothetical protein AABZ30_16620, partial [Myxococcota bacterium]